jgi:hypothetical protein
MEWYYLFIYLFSLLFFLNEIAVNIAESNTPQGFRFKSDGDI